MGSTTYRPILLQVVDDLERVRDVRNSLGEGNAVESASYTYISSEKLNA